MSQENKARKAYEDPLGRALSIAISIETAVDLDRTVYMEDVKEMIDSIEQAIKERQRLLDSRGR